jgi:hypothetical protein
MAADLIPESVKEFITSNIDSIAELEALLLLRSDPGCDWTTDALAARLYTSHEQTVETMAKLGTIGLSRVKQTEPTTFHYQPSSNEQDVVVAALAETYSKYLIPVTNLIHSKPRSKVQQFADAFKLRKRRDE